MVAWLVSSASSSTSVNQRPVAWLAVARMRLYSGKRLTSSGMPQSWKRPKV